MRTAEGVVEKVRNVFSIAHDKAAAVDPELALYGAFANDADRRLLREVRSTPPSGLATRTFPFIDARFTDLLFRYRARNFPHTLSTEEHARWSEFRTHKLTTKTETTTLTLAEYFTMVDVLRAEPTTTPEGQILLDQLQDWGLQLSP